MLVAACGRAEPPADGSPSVVASGTTSDGAARSVCGSPIWSDEDGDGYGAGMPQRSGCTSRAGYAPRGGDCDDDNALVHPGAKKSWNGADDDCNGAVDDARPGTLVLGDHDIDLGDVTGADVDGDGARDLLYTVRSESEWSAAVHLLHGPDWPVRSYAEPDARIWGWYGFGDVVAADLDRDGADELLLAESTQRHVLPGSLPSLDESVAVLDAPGTAAIADEGTHWLLATTRNTEARIWRLPATGAQAAEDALAVLGAEEARGWEEVFSSALGDVDGDGRADLAVVHARYRWEGDEVAERAADLHLFRGPLPAGGFELGDADLSSSFGDDFYSGSVAVVPDGDGDGLGELLVGTAWVSRSGARVAVLRGPIGADGIDAADTVIELKERISYHRAAGASAGALDADGAADWIVYGWTHAYPDTWLVSGFARGRVELSAPLLDGSWAGGVGDLDADGRDDLVANERGQLRALLGGIDAIPVGR